MYNVLCFFCRARAHEAYRGPLLWRTVKCICREIYFSAFLGSASANQAGSRNLKLVYLTRPHCSWYGQPLEAKGRRNVNCILRSVDLETKLSSHSFSQTTNGRICFSILTTRKYLKLEFRFQDQYPQRNIFILCIELIGDFQSQFLT